LNSFVKKCLFHSFIFNLYNLWDILPVPTEPVVVAVVSVDTSVVICEGLAEETEIVSTEDISVVVPETLVRISVSYDVAVEVWDVDKVVDASVSLTISVTIKYQIHN